MPRVSLAVLLVGLGWRAAGADLPVLVPLAYLAVVTGELWRIDREERRLPNALVVPGIVVALVGVVSSSVATGRPGSVAFIAGAAYAGVLLVPALFGAAGMGDVKLGALLGLALGPLGPFPALVGPAVAFLVGGVAALAMMAAAGRRSDEDVPFGPFMLGAFWGAVALAPVL